MSRAVGIEWLISKRDGDVTSSRCALVRPKVLHTEALPSAVATLGMSGLRRQRLLDVAKNGSQDATGRLLGARLGERLAA